MEKPDEEPARVNLPPMFAIPGGGREGVVEIVITFAKTDKRPEEAIAAVIGRLVMPFAENMAIGIDSPSDLMHQEDASRTAPEKSGQGSAPRLTDESAGNRRNCHAQETPEDDPAIHEPDDSIRFQPYGAGVGRRRGSFTDPADMGVEEPFDQIPFALAEFPRRMGILAGFVAVFVVIGMPAAPIADRALNGHRAAYSEEELNQWRGRESLVSEVSMIPNRDSEASNQVKGHKQRQVGKTYASSQCEHGSAKTHERADDEDQRNDLVRETDLRLVLVRFQLSRFAIGNLHDSIHGILSAGEPAVEVNLSIVRYFNDRSPESLYHAPR